MCHLTYCHLIVVYKNSSSQAHLDAQQHSSCCPLPKPINSDFLWYTKHMPHQTRKKSVLTQYITEYFIIDPILLKYVPQSHPFITPSRVQTTWCILWCASIIDRVRMPTSLSRRYLLRFRRMGSVITTYEVVVSIGIRQWHELFDGCTPTDANASQQCFLTMCTKVLDSALTFSITRRANDTGPTTVCWGGSWWTQWYHVNVHRR